MSIKESVRVAAGAAVVHLPDLLMIVGALGVSYGAALVYVPAGYVVGGLFAMTAGVVLARGVK